MKIWFFTETAYPYLPETYESIRVVLPNKIYEPRAKAGWVPLVLSRLRRRLQRG